ncbi:hypothetical protein SAMN05216296_0072 [Pseudomonas pohangensis]|uniref:PglZ domain-containing protein n=1 Tax=Pseudomonas pohangensis TaxID=364197 RepID=A0A1H2DVW0_9PSED|nr:BREX-1 system phosphatase PglZ type B [Pseudomonas pohangensis]SDT86976.1 hypothetical protein SAMN05216296_0072 [Pseudomonas pohangensis]
MTTTTIIQALAEALISAAKVNASVQVKPAAVLWADADSQWLPVIDRLREIYPGLLGLGEYQPDAGKGPAIWLKCAVAGLIPEYPVDQLPCVLHLPGVSRSDLRAIESCPRDLQPLAELQYRGVLWGQANGKDWTVNAFLTSKNGGLGLNVSQDQATQDALRQVLLAGLLMDMSLEELQGRRINAEWLQSLLAPNPVRDLLLWLNDPASALAQWDTSRREVFIQRCKSDFGFHPVNDGQLVAADNLAKAEGRWAAVAELYRDSFSSYPNILGLLAKLEPPQLGLFDDLAAVAGYPQVNEGKESALRYALSAIGSMTVDHARTAILAADKEHAVRREWLWAQMGRAPLALALEHLSQVAVLSAKLPVGVMPDQLAASYQESGWKVDAAALRSLAAVQSSSDLAAVSAALRAVYWPWLEEAARRLQEATRTAGGLAKKPTSAAPIQSNGTCTVFVDGLRYDVAVQLMEKLTSLGEASLGARWTSMPSVTASGKAWCSPVAHLVSGNPAEIDFEPSVTAEGKPLSAHNFRKLLSDNGVQPLGKHEIGDADGIAWTEAGDLDHYGHQHGVRLARDLDIQLAQVIERITELKDAGWRYFQIVTDHGWLLLPGGLPKSELPMHQAQTRWGRCAVLRDSAHGTPLTFGWDWCKDVQIAYAPGITSFIAGNEYAHGGLSLQECLVPVITLKASGAPSSAVTVTIKSVIWKGLRCVVQVEPADSGLTVDIRTKPALANSSIAASTKALENGKANLAIADDEHLGTAAVVVVLNQDGDVLQKSATTIGG